MNLKQDAQRQRSAEFLDGGYLLLLFIGSIGLNWYGYLMSPFYGNMLVIAFFIMMTSWNEWLESTAIEPSMEFGELFLHNLPNSRVSIILRSTIIHDCNTTSSHSL